jgi:3-dehydroquinate dehydratase / shikimate dehydrogenase
MICVVLGRTRHTRMIAEHNYLAEQGVKLVELRVDFIGRAIDLSRLLTNRPTPVIVTARRQSDGGRWMKTEEERLMLLRSVIASGVEYVDLESDIADKIPRYGKTKRIVSLHNFDETPENLEEIHAEMSKLDADIVKIATMATTFSDNLRMMNLVKNAKVPTIGICMGEIGVITRIVANRLGSPFTYAAFSDDKEVAPGQVSWKDMTSLYNYENITKKTKLYGVIADPVAHSYSPLIHNKAFQHLGIDACYLPFRVAKDDLHAFMESCDELGINGLSITIPHKTAAMDYCTQAETAANGIGAINTMVTEDGHRAGYNTDYRAAMDCIMEAFKLDASLKSPMHGITALVLGAGGVTRAIAWGLKQRGAEVTISSRTEDSAKSLAGELGCRYVLWDDRYDNKYRLLINGTPVGMHPDVDSSPYMESALNPLMVVFDTVYNPEHTMLVKYAKRQQARVITGVDMFVRQAAYQFKLFTGREAPAGLMRDTIKMATNPVKINN